MTTKKKHQPPKRPLPNERKAAKPVMAWGLKTKAGELAPVAKATRAKAAYFAAFNRAATETGARVVRVKIVEVRR